MITGIQAGVDATSARRVQVQLILPFPQSHTNRTVKAGRLPLPPRTLQMRYVVFKHERPDHAPFVFGQDRLCYS